jgi:hypothetical protein
MGANAVLDEEIAKLRKKAAMEGHGDGLVAP